MKISKHVSMTIEKNAESNKFLNDYVKRLERQHITYKITEGQTYFVLEEWYSLSINMGN